MKKFSSIGTLLLVFALSACSSGSSDESDNMTSTNTIPAASDSADPDSTDPSEDDSTAVDAGSETAGPGQDTGSGNQIEDTDTNTENVDTGDQNTDDSSAITSGNEDTVDTSTDEVGMVDTIPDTTVDGGTIDSTTDDNPADTAAHIEDNTDSSIGPTSDFGEFQARIKTLTSRTLIGFNQSLNQGEMLTPEQEECLGAFDPAMGDPLLAVECAEAQATGSVPIYMSVASFENTEQCRLDLLNATTDQCNVDVAAITVNTLWTIPEVAPGQPERPIPNEGATITYNVLPNVVSIGNLDQNVSGRFNCEFDLSTGEVVSEGLIGDCDSELNRITNLIDMHLSNI